MPVKIEPTVGRVVYFFATTDLGWGEHTDDASKPRAAIVSDVLSPALVNLAVFDRGGGTHPMPSVRLLQDGETPQDGEVHWAEWMPFQKGQAAKLEATKSEPLAERPPTTTATTGDDPAAYPNRATPITDADFDEGVPPPVISPAPDHRTND